MSVSYTAWDMNNLTEAPAWVVHKIWAGGSSARVLFFTRGQGLIWAKYQGGWAPKKQALLQAYLPLWLELVQRHGWYYVRHLEIAGIGFEFAATNLLTVLYVNELLYLALRPEDPHPDLYDAYLTTLQQLSLATSRSSLESVLRRFEWALLQSIGYGIVLTHEAQSYQPIAAASHYLFRAGQGFFLTQSGILGAHILAIAQDNLTDPMVRKTAKQIMRHAIEHAIGGKEIKTRALFS